MMDLVFVELSKCNVLDRVDRIIIYHLILRLQDYILPSECSEFFQLFYEATFGTSIEYYNFLRFLINSYDAIS